MPCASENHQSSTLSPWPKLSSWIRRFALCSLLQTLLSFACSPTDTILCDTSTGTQCPLIPLDWRRVIFDSMHGLSHPGIRATQKLITARFIWPGVNADVRRWSRSCIQCQRSKIHRHTIAPLQSQPLPQARFDIVHIDLVGPLPPFKYSLTC